LKAQADAYIASRVGGLEKLLENHTFLSAVFQATRVAGGTHLSEKRAMLRNAMVNIAVGDAPDEDLQHIFLNLIDQRTVSHVKVLKFIKNGLPRGSNPVFYG
jgi:hypothetical protein